MWFTVASLHVAPAAIALYISWRISWILWIILSSLIVKFSVSIKLLYDTVEAGGSLALENKVDSARRVVQGIVRRDLSRASLSEVCSAAIESLFESYVDGILSPLIYYALLGPLACFIQRIANTLDGALGFRTPELERVGWFSAKADTTINYIPARIASLLIIASCPSKARVAFRIYRRYCSATESLNAGHPMSAAAGCLGVLLFKKKHYVIGEGDPPAPSDVFRALSLFKKALILGLVLTLALTLL